jgi:hypothetical protein
MLGLSRRESWWKDAEILMLRHQLAMAEREHRGVHTRLTWPDRAWLALKRSTVNDPPAPARSGQPRPPRITAIRLTIAGTARSERLARQHAAGLITRARLAFCLR